MVIVYTGGETEPVSISLVDLAMPVGYHLVVAGLSCARERVNSSIHARRSP